MILNICRAHVTLILALGLGLTLNGCSPGTTDAGTGGGTAATGGGAAATGGGGAVATGPFQTTRAIDAGTSPGPVVYMGVDGSRNLYFLNGTLAGSKMYRRNFASGTVDTIVDDATNYRCLDVDPTGNIYSSKLDGQSKIYKIAPVPNSTAVVQAVVDGFVNDIGVSRSGDVYFSASSSNGGDGTITKVGDGGTLTQIGNGLADPHAIGVDSTNTIYVADSRNGLIKSFTAGGPDTGQVITAMQNGRTGLAVDNAGTLYYVADGGALVMRAKGAATTAPIPYDGVTIQQLRVDADGTVLYIADEEGNLYISKRQ